MAVGDFDKVIVSSDEKELISLEPNVEEGGVPIGGKLLCRDIQGAIGIVLSTANAEFGSPRIAILKGGVLTISNVKGQSRVLIHCGEELENEDGGTISLRAPGDPASLPDGSDFPGAIALNASKRSLAIGNGITSVALGVRSGWGGPNNPYIEMRDVSGRETISVSGANATLSIGAMGIAGEISVRDSAGEDIFNIDGGNAALYIGAKGNEGDIVVRDGAGEWVFHVNGGDATLSVGVKGKAGGISVRDDTGESVIRVDGVNANLFVGAEGNEGDIVVRDGAGKERIHLNGSAGDILLQNADCAEEFDVAPSENIEPGTVMILGQEGRLRISSEAFDKKVAGVISGAGSYRPALVLDRTHMQNDRVRLSLMGKAYCKVDAQYSPIEVGDLLTTSPTPGHAMKADDPFKAFGAVIGKALRPLESGSGLIPILIALQ